MALSTPVKAVVTGRYGPYKVSRNPFSWLGLLAFGILLIPFTLFVYPVIILLTYFGLRRVALTGNNATILRSGLRIFSEKEGIIGNYSWSEIEQAERRFSPPVMYPAIKLKSGKWTELHLADFQEILGACRSNGVTVNDRVQYK